MPVKSLRFPRRCALSSTIELGLKSGPANIRSCFVCRRCNVLIICYQSGSITDLKIVHCDELIGVLRNKSVTIYDRQSLKEKTVLNFGMFTLRTDHPTINCMCRL